MAIEVRIPTILRPYTAGAKAVESTGDTIAELLTNLDASHPGLRGRLITEDGGLHRFVNIYVNDEDIRFIGALDAKLADGDTVTILPAVAGGATILPAVAGGATILPAVAGGATILPAVAGGAGEAGPAVLRG